MRVKKNLVLVIVLVLVLSNIGLGWGATDNSIGQGINKPVPVPSQTIAIYADTGVDSQTVTALCEAFHRMGHDPMTIAMGDILNNRVTTDNFDVVVLPAGEQGSIDSYLVPIIGDGYDFSDEFADAITSFVSSGGGVIGIETGARLLCSTGQWDGTAEDYFVDLYSGNCTGPLTEIGEGMAKIGFSNPRTCTSNTYTAYVGRGATYFSVDDADYIFGKYLGCGSNHAKASIIGFDYGAGHVCLVGPNLELEEDTLRDFSVWDNIKNYGYDGESDLNILAKVVEYSALGTTDKLESVSNIGYQNGKRIAVYSLHDTDGGAWPGYMGAITKAVISAGHIPLAINADTIKNGDLTTAHFDAVIFPGGYSYGYQQQLSGYESEITDFINDGGGCLGICAGSFYLSNNVVWEGTSYNYPVDIFTGNAVGPINDIAAWPYRVMTPVAVNDSTLGLNSNYTVTYYGGPYFDNVLNQNITTTGTYAHPGTPTTGEDAIIRFEYGNGKVALFGPHPETEEGYLNDWTWWDNYEYNSSNAQTDPDSEWPIIDACLDWMTNGNSSQAISDEGIHLAIMKTNNDSTGDGLCDAQREDGIDSTAFNNGYYTVYGNQTMELCGFGEKSVSNINDVTLKIKMYVGTNYNGNKSVQWSTDGNNYHNTTITPSTSGFHTLNFDLHAAGVDTMEELMNLRIRFDNNSTNYWYSYVSFDYVHVEVN